MGELHLEIIVDRMKRENNLDCNVGRPEVAYKEAITKKVNNIVGKYVQQSGGRGKYGHVVIDVGTGRAWFSAMSSSTRSRVDRSPANYAKAFQGRY